ncbi:hypothetical protein Hanom_Chr03g00242951 [Helianthus anomalus]
MQACEVILADVNRRLMEAEARAAKAKEERDDMATMNANLVADCTWMQNFGVVHVANAILDEPENTNAVDEVVGHAREAGYKSDYTECLAHVNIVYAKKFTNERCALRGVDTEAAMKVVTDAYDGLIVPALAQIEECLAADD